jgi:hypothetical protein
MDIPLLQLQPGEFRGFIIGVLGSVVASFIVIAIIRYWKYRSLKSIMRRIDVMEERKLHLENLAKSDRYLLMYFFQMLFGILLWYSSWSIILPFLLFLKGYGAQYVYEAVFMWGPVWIVSWYVFYRIFQTEHHSDVIKDIDENIEYLKKKSSELNK